MRKGGWLRRFVVLSFVAVVVFAVSAFLSRATRAEERSPSAPDCRQVLIAQEKPTVNPTTTQPDEPATMPPVANAKSETERYTLSHERYDKAVAYSRAGYTVYFVWILLGLLVAWLFLQLGIAAKIRDFAEELTENRFLQGLIFLPVLVVGIDIFELPVLLYW